MPPIHEGKITTGKSSNKVNVQGPVPQKRRILHVSGDCIYASSFAFCPKDEYFARFIVTTLVFSLGQLSVLQYRFNSIIATIPLGGTSVYSSILC
jgi:hypothetical protein